jgi:glyoxylase-like metal-dependent hydrolase (beta-lactamase superfamily II)
VPLRTHAPGIYGWSRFQPERGYDFSGTALVSDGRVLLVDPVPATDEELNALQRLGTQFEIVVLNAHHERDAAAFQQRFNAPVFVSAPDASELKLTGARPFQEEHEFAGGWIGHILPNMKTPGEAVLYHPKLRVVVAGDAVIGDPLTGLRLVPPAKLPNRAGALASLRTLSQLDFDGLILGDGFSLPSGGRDALRRFLAAQS